MGNRAAIFAITQYEFRSISDIDDLAGIGLCDTMSIQTEVKSFARLYLKSIVSCHITRQIDIGSISIRIICNLICSIPLCPCDIFTYTLVVANICMRCSADGVAAVLRPIQHRHAAKLHLHGESGRIFSQSIPLLQNRIEQVAAGTGSLLRIVVTGPAVQRNSLRAVLCGGGNFRREYVHDFVIENGAFRIGFGQGKYATDRVNDLQSIHPAPRRNLSQAAHFTDIGARVSLHRRDISAVFAVFMRAVQFLPNTPA